VFSNPIPLHNSGLVLLNQYIPMLFERLGLTQDNNFVSDDTQKRAVVWLHYLVTGLTQASEQELVLNKVLCGVAVNVELDSLSLDVSGPQEKLVEGLLNAVMSYWPEAGTTSLDGFRGNWLVRDGILIEAESDWSLTVEKRAYDVLLDKSPFSYSMIKFPWMEKMVRVNWDL
jgi:hypothetical protein